ncbi:integral membrane HRF1 family protein [Actinidia rufa]|uniref:Integral membrane HRF1 family protein n=1 Tax=Actinidia rufa TaxID=165716 RepID=A0A7J0F265_9ERIC|nr:integral membrane HRF1 family protein [Actinidia rufa]
MLCMRLKLNKQMMLNNATKREESSKWNMTICPTIYLKLVAAFDEGEHISICRCYYCFAVKWCDELVSFIHSIAGGDDGASWLVFTIFAVEDVFASTEKWGGALLGHNCICRVRNCGWYWPPELVLPEVELVSAVRFPIASVKNPSYLPESRSIPNTHLVELLKGIVHMIPRKLSPGLSQGLTRKFQGLRKMVELCWDQLPASGYEELLCLILESQSE